MSAEGYTTIAGSCQRWLPAFAEPLAEWPDSPEREAVGSIAANAHQVVEREHAFPHTGPYKTLGGTVELEEGGRVRGTMSFTMYRLMESGKSRPVVIVMDGGPISSSNLWLAPGLTAPWNIVHESDGSLRVGMQLTPQKDPVLRHADIVHIDPMGTGYGKAYAGQEQRYYGMIEDAEAHAAVAKWCFEQYDGDAERRLILLGASFGGKRIVEVGSTLLDDGYDIAALASISGGYDDNLRWDTIFNPRAHITSVPAMALAAQYHKQLGPDKQNMTPGALYEQAALFAWGDYAEALMAGWPPKGRAKDKVLESLSSFTGLSADVIAERDMRITLADFRTLLLGGQGLQLGGSDLRRTFPEEAESEFDVALEAVRGPYVKLATEHLSTHFGYTSEPDNTFVGNVNAAPQWSYTGRWSGRGAQVAMRGLFNRLPKLRILETNGRFDGLGLSERRRVFWETVTPETPMTVHLYDHGHLPHAVSMSAGTVSRCELLSGHGPGQDPVAQEQTVRLLGQLCRVVTP